ncbi:MAG TPA: DUF87 domain-containing protein, partial [Thermoplasmata archaeon]|nr:DUF87 domain-containing protein [Thermoplasmata archaeon]
MVGTLHFRWSSGASGGFWLGVEGGSGARWVQSALRTLYDPGQWPRAETLPSGTVVAEVGRTAGLLGAPILPVSPDMALSDALWRGFRAAGAGAWLEGWATPCPMPAHPPPLLARPMEPMPASERDRVSPADDPERRLRNRIEERRQEPHWAVRLVVARDLAAPATAAQALGRLTAALLRFPGGAAVDFRAPRRWGSSRPPPVLDFAVSELAALLPAPWAVGDQGAREGEGSLAIAVGRSDGGAVAKLPIPPREGRHLLVLGETGTGKSSSLLRLARSAATRGSLVLFDPVGDTAERFSQVLPSPLARRVRWIGPDDPGSGTNALADIGGRRDAVQRERSTASLVNAFRQLRLARFPDTAFWGPRIEEHLAAALRAAAASPGATLVEAYELLDSGASGFSGWSAEGRQAVAEFDRWSRERREDGEGAQRLLGEIIRDPILRRLLCASPPDWSTDGLFAAGSITVFRGQAAEVGEPTARAL